MDFLWGSAQHTWANSFRKENTEGILITWTSQVVQKLEVLSLGPSPRQGPIRSTGVYKKNGKLHNFGHFMNHIKILQEMKSANWKIGNLRFK